jgi:DNA-binding MarR family transcriptional regulator
MTGQQKDGEKKVLTSLKKIGNSPYTRKIANEAGMSPQTASKYLSILEAKGLVKKDDSQPPHIHWTLVEKMGK